MFSRFQFLSLFPTTAADKDDDHPKATAPSTGGLKTSLLNGTKVLGLSGWSPLIKRCFGVAPAEPLPAKSMKAFLMQGMRGLFRSIGLPLLAILIFLGFWAGVATQVKTSLGQLPGPVQVYQQGVYLFVEHFQEREKEKVFYQRQQERNVLKLQEDADADTRIRPYTGKPTFVDQIFTSLITVFTGFLIAIVIAVPLGVACGLSDKLYAALSPLIQIFKPVSPLAWLPIVTMVVSAVYVSDDPMFQKSFVTSAITVMLCSLWPSLINTAVGVASIDKDLLNVGRVLRLNWWTTVYKIAIPSALPMIFTGMRISLGIGWMVLIAAEMLAQNPGLGKFVWDEFQNGSSDSLSRIMVAVLVIGGIGFLLDWVMQTLQKLFSHDKNQIMR